MTIEKLESLVGVMSNEQFEKFQVAVYSLITDQSVFSAHELEEMDKKARQKITRAEEISKNGVGFTRMKVAE